jgi:hypothetical protein
VEVSSGSIPSLDDQAALAGGNLFAIRGENGRWEIFSAASSILIATSTFRLSRFLRGLGGSEDEAARMVQPGATIVRLDEAVTSLSDAVDDLGAPWSYRIGPSGRDHGDTSGVTFTGTVTAEPLKPLSPVHISARRVAGAVHLQWVRRTRTGGDGWEQAEVPLGEAIERYEIDILHGASVRRTLVTDRSSAIYDAALEAADFGGPQSVLSIRVAQVSAVVGRGFSKLAHLSVA